MVYYLTVLSNRSLPLGLTGLNAVSEGLHSFLEAPEQNPLPCLFWLLEAARRPWLVAPFLHPHRPQSPEVTSLWPLPQAHLPLTFFCLHLPLLRTLMITLGLPDNPGCLPHLRILNVITSKTSLSPCKVTYSQALGIKVCKFLWNHFFSTLFSLFVFTSSTCSTCTSQMLLIHQLSHDPNDHRNWQHSEVIDWLVDDREVRRIYFMHLPTRCVICYLWGVG